jgi:hypothetical protein
LTAGGGQPVQHGGLGVFEVRERQDPLGLLLLATVSTSGIGDGSFTIAESFTDASPCGIYHDERLPLSSTSADWEARRSPQLSRKP